MTMLRARLGEFRPVLEETSERLAHDHGTVQPRSDLHRRRGEELHRRVVQDAAFGRGCLLDAAQLQAHSVEGRHQLADDEEVQRHPTAIRKRGTTLQL